jgi:hypothetical protein
VTFFPGATPRPSRAKTGAGVHEMRWPRSRRGVGRRISPLRAAAWSSAGILLPLVPERLRRRATNPENKTAPRLIRCANSGPRGRNGQWRSA